MRRHLAVALGLYLAGAVLFAAFVAVPFLTKKRDIPAAVPSPPPLVATSVDDLRAGQTLCMSDIAISAESAQMRFKVGTYRRPGPPLAVTVTGSGYRAAANVAAGYADNATLAVAVPRPPGSRLVKVCIRNRGRHKVGFYAAADRAESHASVVVAGKRVVATPTLIFYERKPSSVASQAGVIAGRIAVFRGFLDHAWVVWLLALLALVAVPLLVAAGLAAALRDQLRTVSSGAGSGSPE
jgi:hypothetical protein